MRTSRVVLLFLLILCVAAPPMLAQKPVLKKRVAVMVFEDKSDQSVGWWDRRYTPGEGISDMLTTALVNTDRYIVLERQEIDALLREQNLGQSGVVTAESAAKVGQMLGVELAVLGAVTAFGYKKSDIGGDTRRLGIGIENQAAVVGLDVRLVDTGTGEVVAAEDVTKEESKKGLRVRTNVIRFQSRTEFDQSLVGEATRAAVDEVVRLIDDRAGTLRWQAKVVTASGGTVIINAGAQGGVRVGDRFVVFRPGEELIDPDTGLSLGSLDTQIGEIEVVDNEIGGGKASQCRVVSGQGMERGDIVREGD